MKPYHTLLIGLIGGLLIGLAVGKMGFSQTKPKEAARRHIKLPGSNPDLPFSDGVLVGNTLHLAGRLGLDPKTSKIPDDLDQEIRNIFDGFQAVLKEADMTMDDIVSVTVYCPDTKLYEQFNKAYRGYFKKDFPSRAFIGSGPLLRDAHFELQAVAVK